MHYLCTRVPMTEIYPVLKQHRKIDEVFRYQDLAALAGQLKRA